MSIAPEPGKLHSRALTVSLFMPHQVRQRLFACFHRGIQVNILEHDLYRFKKPLAKRPSRLNVC
jgi:hypothetical protein